MLEDALAEVRHLRRLEAAVSGSADNADDR